MLMKFEDASHAAEAKARLEALLPTIPTLMSLQADLDSVRAEGSWDLALRTSHDDATGLKSYQDHPDHLELVRWLRPKLASRAVVDFDS